MEQVIATDRLGTRCAKWDGMEEKFGQSNLLPLWVADMDFECPKAVKEVLTKRAEHNVYGYGIIPDRYHQAFIDWEEKVHGYKVERAWLQTLPGVVVGFFWALNLFTNPGDGCIILTPLYGPFQNSIVTTGRKLVESKLQNDHGVYTIDFADVEQKIVDEQVKVFFLCSPHNPVGRVWTKDELKKVADLCKRYDLLLICDEIHQDIIPGSRKQIPMGTVTDYQKKITLTAPSKTFNLAGCQNAFAIIEDRDMFDAWQTYRQTIGINEGNIFGYLAAEAAYQHGYDWLQSLNQTIAEHFRYLRDTLLAALPNLVISPLEGTYLAWVDFGAYLAHDELVAFCQEKCGIAPNYGDDFSLEKNETHLRINLATAKENIEKAVEQIVAQLA